MEEINVFCLDCERPIVNESGKMFIVKDPMALGDKTVYPLCNDCYNKRLEERNKERSW